MASKVVVVFCIVAALCVTSCAEPIDADIMPGDSPLVTFRASDKAFGRHLLALTCQYDPGSAPCSDPFLPYCCETKNNNDGSSCVQLSSDEASECGTRVPYPACCVKVSG